MHTQNAETAGRSSIWYRPCSKGLTGLNIKCSYSMWKQTNCITIICTPNQAQRYSASPTQKHKNLKALLWHLHSRGCKIDNSGIKETAKALRVKIINR
jgi:hypothetical protein